MDQEQPRLSHKQQVAIVALMVEPTIIKAAEKADVHERTIRKWLKQDRFSEAFREARCQTMRRATARLQSLTEEAVETLQRNMHCGVPSVETRAASAVLDHAVTFLETDDLLGRIEALEGVVQETEIRGFG